MSHDAHLSDPVGVLRPDICPDCRALLPQVAADTFSGVEVAQANLNRAVSAWANRRSAREGSQVDIDLFQAQYQFQIACQRAFMETAKPYPLPRAKPTPTPVPEYVVPEAPMARELRIANLLAVVKYPATIPQGDRVRVVALMRALEMLGLDVEDPPQ
jgi:hypothetical protein